MTRKYILGALLAMLLIAPALYFYSGGQVPPGQAPLMNISAQNVTDVKNQFNAAKDNVRVLLLLSPT